MLDVIAQSVAGIFQKTAPIWARRAAWVFVVVGAALLFVFIFGSY
jgi:hypothetical protein